MGQDDFKHRKQKEKPEYGYWQQVDKAMAEEDDVMAYENREKNNDDIPKKLYVKLRQARNLK